MASLDHRLNPLFSIKECMSCGALYTRNCGCSKGSLEDKILVPKPPQNCATCGNPVDGLYCRSCAFVRKCLNEGWYTIHDENEILNTSESSNDNTNVVSAPREPFVFNQDPGVNSSQSPLQINHNCCYKCGDSLDDIFCQRCTCKSCGNGAHIGYNCPPKAPIISNPEQCNQTINELPQTLPSVHPTCNSGDENSFTYDSKPNSVDDSPNVFNPPPQPSMYSCEFCGNDARYGHYFSHPIILLNETNKRKFCKLEKDFWMLYQAFLKEYDHIPPNEKCMALLLAEERFLKIKQTMEEEQNQPEVMQELLLKLMDDLQILKGIQQEKEKPTAQSFTPYENFSMIDDVEVLMRDIYTFLRKFSRIPFGVTPKVILIAWEKFGEIKHALTDKQYRQEDIQELMSKLLEDVKPKEITPDLPIEEPDNSLILGDEHLDIILEMESDEIIKSSVEILVPIPSEFEGISDDTCDVPVCEDPSPFDALNDHSEILSNSNDDGTSSDDDDFEDLEYVSLEEVNDVDQEEKDFDLEDIIQIQNVILREKLLNISRLITNIESLNDNPTPDHVFKSSSSFPIPVTDSDSFFEKSDTFLSYSDNSLPEFEPFSDDTEETRSGSTTTHANNSLPEYDSFLFEIEPDQGELTNVVIEEVDTFLVPEDSIPPGIENNFDAGGDCPDCEDSRAHGFVHSYIRASYPQLHLGNPISLSYRLTFIFSIINKRL
ncbi:hypothetical protein Tco_0145009 [Tanacetum coccineum]